MDRTRQLTITEGTLTFGFRAAAVDDPAGAAAAAALADLDLLQARRHAVILAGHNLPDDLAVLRQAAGVPSRRGLAATERAWQNRHTRGRGIAAVFDTAADLPGSPGLEQVCRLAGAIDVEWSKNYRTKGGSVPFCYSVVWLAIPGSGGAISTETALFWCRSAYVEHSGGTGPLADDAAAALAQLARHVTLVAGHQLCSDLAVLAAASAPHPVVADAGIAWKERRNRSDGHPRIAGTRYGSGHILACRSRRLAGICADLQLDVTQPELRGTSVTALHRRWLETSDAAALEKIAVLSLRHALSTAVVAVRAAGLGSWRPGLNASRLLAAGLGSTFEWLKDPVFRALLGEPGAA